MLQGSAFSHCGREPLLDAIMQSNSPVSAGVTVSGGFNQCSKHRATLIYNKEGIAPHEPGKGNAWLPAAQQPWKEAGCSQLSRNEVAPSVHGNS